MVLNLNGVVKSLSQVTTTQISIHFPVLETLLKECVRCKYKETPVSVDTLSSNGTVNPAPLRLCVPVQTSQTLLLAVTLCEVGR